MSFTVCEFSRGEQLERSLVEGAASFAVKGIAPGESLPTADGDIDVLGYEFQAIRSTTYPLGRLYRGA